ncbi:MAG: prolipoprotein diacylglyceryl transferase, partial [Dehalococcoidia bacterium]
MIRIGINPDIFSAGNFIVSWHGFLTFVAVAVAVYLVARWARRYSIESDIIYAVAIWVVIGGILGARFIHVVDRWEVYGQNPGQIFAVWRGGIALYGAILFGFLGGAMYVWGRQLLGRIYSGQTLSWAKRLVSQSIAEGYLKGEVYARFKNLSVGRLADITAPALIIAQTIGRVGDVINGEHLSTRTNLPWGFVYSHASSLSNQVYGLTASHPVVAYEMIWNMVVLGIVWKLRGRLAPPGMLFALYLMLYSLGRFFLQFLRLDKVWFSGL